MANCDIEHKMQLENLNRKTLALISEISMEKAHNLDLQNKSKQLETTVQLANERLLKGEPPSDEMLEEWMKLIRDENRRREDKLEKHAKFVEMQKHILPAGL